MMNEHKWLVLAVVMMVVAIVLAVRVGWLTAILM